MGLEDQQTGKCVPKPVHFLTFPRVEMGSVILDSLPVPKYDVRKTALVTGSDGGTTCSLEP